MRRNRWLPAIWLCFLVRAFFYCAVLPIWEGFDEWSHFAVLQHMALRGEPLVNRYLPVPRDVAASLDLAPVAWENRNIPPPAAVHDVFWQLPAEERARREREFRAIPPGWALQDSQGNLTTYEALQGPLSGWMLSPVLWVFRGAHLATQVLLLRWFSMAVLSLVIPLTFGIGQRVFPGDGPALACAAVVAAMPGFLIGIARVSNEYAAVTLFALLIYLSLQELTRGRMIAIGVTLGLGLLAKAYFLTAIPPLALVLWRGRRSGLRSLLVPALSLTIAGWWYVRNLVTTGTLTGMLESVAEPSSTFAAKIQQALHIPWLAAIDGILFPHLWLGAWSTLTVRSWMYHLFYLLIGIAAVGLLIRKITWPAGILAAYFVTFWAGQLYHAALLARVWGMATSLGTYLNAVTGAEVPLCVAGLSNVLPGAARRFAGAAGVALFALLDLYTIHWVALPYYTGQIAHRVNHGAITAFHPAAGTFTEMLTRVAAFKSVLLPIPVLASLWLFYLFATLALVAISFAASRK